MRSILAGLALAALLLGVGCNVISPHRRDTTGGRGVTDEQIPTVEQLVRYLNENSRLLGDSALKCSSLSLDCKADGQTVGLGGSLVCQMPRNFRLRGQVLSQPEVDIGSNDQEFWYWIKRNNPPYLFHCSYEDLARGVSVPFPFQPDMVVAALGLAHYDLAKGYKLNAPRDAKYYELIEQATSPQGQPIQKVVVFSRTQQTPPQPQVIAHAVRDGKGQNICIANISRVQQNRETGAILPRSIKFNWPAQNLQMTMELNNLEVVKLNSDQVARMFTRSNLGYQTFDLARRAPDGQASLQPATATMPQQ